MDDELKTIFNTENRPLLLMALHGLNCMMRAIGDDEIGNILTECSDLTGIKMSKGEICSNINELYKMVKKVNIV